MLRRLFLDHPETMGESYLEHQAVALSFAWPLLLASLACAVHALVPGLFTSTGSRAIVRLNDRLAAGRRGSAAFPGMYSI
jgi:hypothetical protein